MNIFDESILGSTKEHCCISPSCDEYDKDIMALINTNFARLNQRGVGNSLFVLSDCFSTWRDFPASDEIRSLLVSYIFIKVGLVFDTPSSSYVSDLLKEEATELEWRMQTQSEHEKIEERRKANA